MAATIAFTIDGRSVEIGGGDAVCIARGAVPAPYTVSSKASWLCGALRG
jgi:hypothetical protein